MTLVVGMTGGTIYPLSAQAQVPSQACLSLVAGTYLLSITDAQGNATSRAIFTFHDDGTFSTIDSSQAGVVGQFNPFTDTQGPWACTGINTFTASGLNFDLSGSESTEGGLARADYTAEINQQTGELKGELELRFFPLNGNPLTDEGRSGGSFSFTALRVTLPTQ